MLLQCLPWKGLAKCSPSLKVVRGAYGSPSPGSHSEQSTERFWTVKSSLKKDFLETGRGSQIHPCSSDVIAPLVSGSTPWAARNGRSRQSWSSTGRGHEVPPVSLLVLLCLHLPRPLLSSSSLVEIGDESTTGKCHFCSGG